MAEFYTGLHRFVGGGGYEKQTKKTLPENVYLLNSLRLKIWSLLFYGWITNKYVLCKVFLSLFFSMSVLYTFINIWTKKQITQQMHWMKGMPILFFLQSVWYNHMAGVVHTLSAGLLIIRYHQAEPHGHNLVVSCLTLWMTYRHSKLFGM